MSQHWSANPWKRSTWRTEWDGEPFPVSRLSLSCGQFLDHQQCMISWCDCPCHGVLIPRREVRDAQHQR